VEYYHSHVNGRAAATNFADKYKLVYIGTLERWHCPCPLIREGNGVTVALT